MPSDFKQFITRMRELPQALELAVQNLTDAQLDTPYGEGKWTSRQIVHHLVDAHVNGYIRVRLILTEKNPTLRPYNQEAWAELVDAKSMPIGPSLIALKGIHERFCELLESLIVSDWERTANHPEVGEVTLGRLIEEYADHGESHLKQITSLKSRNNW